MDDVLLRETTDRVAVLTLNRPESRNALSGPLIAALFDALVEADADDGVDVVVLTGSDPAFCAGVDLKEAARDGEAYFRQYEKKHCVAQVALVKKPVIGAINGATFTGGLEIALGCDYLIASERAYFADTHVRVGVLPGGGMTVRLPQAVGLRRAREMSMTGEIVDAFKAERIGLVNEVVPHEHLLERALRSARAMTEVDRSMMAGLKRMYSEGSQMSAGHALAFELTVASEIGPDFEHLAERRDAVMARNRAGMR
jgi:enoyl-CoA hydratase/carnithine racemase